MTQPRTGNPAASAARRILGELQRLTNPIAFAALNYSDDHALLKTCAEDLETALLGAGWYSYLHARTATGSAGAVVAHAKALYALQGLVRALSKSPTTPPDEIEAAKSALELLCGGARRACDRASAHAKTWAEDFTE